MINTVSSAYVTAPSEYENYIMDSNNHIKEGRKGGRGNLSTIVKYEDGTEWIFLHEKPKERFCGFLFLQNALAGSNLNNILPAENKMAIHDRNIIYLSKYCGEIKPDLSKRMTEIHALNDLGFIDTLFGANLREENNKIYVFDTEKRSFAPSILEKIDSFVDLHDAIRSTLEGRLKG